MKAYPTVSLFTGAMGLDLGAEKAGVHIAVCVENDKWCCETIRLNRPKTPLINQPIETVTDKEIIKVSGLKRTSPFLVIGGPPCQAFSTAGSRKSFQDARGNCILEFVRVVKELRPRYFVMENVRGLLSAAIDPAARGEDGEPGSAIRYVAGLFAAEGYAISFALFNTANYGVPQQRERVIVFGNRAGTRIPLPLPTHAQNSVNGRRLWATLRDAIGHLANSKHTHLEFSENRKNYYRLLTAGQNWRNLPVHLQKEAMGNSFLLGGGKTGFYRRLDWNKPSPALVTRPNMPATDLCHPNLLRPLSIEEYKAIQQFPSSWKFAGNVIQQYKQVGNAVPVRMGYVAIKHILDYHHGRLHQEHALPSTMFSRYKNTTDVDVLPSRVSNKQLVFDELVPA